VLNEGTDHLCQLIFNSCNGAKFARSIDVTRTEIIAPYLYISSPTVVGVLGAFTPEDHEIL
jgi:hypothetical protein